MNDAHGDNVRAVEIKVLDSLAEVPASTWDALCGDDPFLQHGFLSGLEATDCLGPQGWYPQHLVAYEGDRVVGTLPLYVRDNSYGEFVFDWAWADAYERAGGRYYPKLVTAIPFSPVSGRRILIDSAAYGAEEVAAALIKTGIQACNGNDISSWHCLFPTTEEVSAFESEGLLTRLGCQYHWFNHEYTNFDDFLSTLTSKKRKQIKRERRRITEQDVAIEVLTGAEISDEHWSVFYRFYCSTFQRKWGEPRLTETFYQTLNERLPGAPVLMLARVDGDYVAGAFSLQGGDTLYGRHWGCSRTYDNLHFELCYYQTIDYCIANGLSRLDAGAQGEHKLARGFVPVSTWSCHWIRDKRFREVVDDFVTRERYAIEQQIKVLETHTAFRSSTAN